MSTENGVSVKKAVSLIAGSMAVVVLYMLVRAVIYHAMKPATLEDWFARDTLMCVPRLLAFITLLGLDRLFWRTVPFDLKIKEFKQPVLWGGVLILVHAIYWSGSSGSLWPMQIITGALFTTVFVGLFEEYAFRGVLLAGLREAMGPVKAVVVSSIIFAVYHFQAQPVSSWLSIFLIGGILACLRLRGVSIFWLTVIHIIIDDAYFFVGLTFPAFLSMHNLLFIAGLLIPGAILLRGLSNGEQAEEGIPA